MDAWSHVVDTLKAAAWPVVTLVIVFTFYRPIRDRLGSLRKATLPGGISLELDALERDVVRASGSPEGNSLSPLVPMRPRDRDDIVAETRFNLERQVRLLAWAITRDEAFPTRSVDDLLLEIHDANEITADELSQLLGFFNLSRVAAANQVTDESAGSLNTVGALLVARLNFRTRVIEVTTGFAGHDLANHLMMAEHAKRGVGDSYKWATIATILPAVGYDYRVFVAAMNRASEIDDDRNWPRGLSPQFLRLLVPKKDFDRVVVFRRNELRRLLRDFLASGSEIDEERYYNWPASWGHVDFNQPIMRRESFRQQDIVDDLLRAEEAVRIAQFRDAEGSQ